MILLNQRGKTALMDADSNDIMQSVPMSVSQRRSLVSRTWWLSVLLQLAYLVIYVLVVRLLGFGILERSPYRSRFSTELLESAIAQTVIVTAMALAYQAVRRPLDRALAIPFVLFPLTVGVIASGFQLGTSFQVSHDRQHWSVVFFVVLPAIGGFMLSLLLLFETWILCRPHYSLGCQECGYDLTGNVSGKCPECGRPVLCN